MAQGDTSRGTVTELTSADSFVVEFTSGARSGETWSVRVFDADAYEPQGPDKYLGQSALAFTRDFLADAADEIDIFEQGLDQYDRITAEVARTSDFAELGPALVGAGYANSMTPVFDDPPGFTTIERSDPRVGDGSPDDLLADTSLP